MSGDNHSRDEGARCSTPCDPDCDAVCHEDHVAEHKKHHWPYDCPAADKYLWDWPPLTTAAFNRLRGERDDLRKQLAAANVRAEALADDVEKLHARVKLARSLMDLAKLGRIDARDERDELRARLDGLGELREEWATRDGGHIDEVNIYATEAEAFAALYSGEDVVRRFAGDWVAVGGRVAPDAAADGHSATQTGAQ